MEEASHRQMQRTRSNGDSELLDMTRHNKFRWRVGKVQFMLPQNPDALFATKRCARKLANHKAAVENNSGESDQVVVHSKYMEFQNGTRSKHIEQTQ